MVIERENATIRAAWLEYLVRSGYQEGTIAGHRLLFDKVQRRLIAHGLSLAALTPERAERLRAELGAQAEGLSVLLRFLRDQRLAPAAPVPPGAVLLAAFTQHLHDLRGLSVLTARTRCDVIRRFLRHLQDQPIDRLRPEHVHGFVREEGGRLASTSMAPVLDALRSFLGFLFLTGRLDRDLSGCLPPVLTHRQAAAPRSVDAATVALLLGSCDRTTESGRRDYAVLMLLSRLGLRASEVAGLHLDEVFWRVGEIAVRGKENRLERLPLPDDVGAALADYLNQPHRPEGPDRLLFRRAVAPDGPLSRNGVVFIPRTASARAGIPTVGAHQLRHTAATGMLAAGASLRDIGQVLRHEREQTTAIYASVAPERLRPLARPWPTGTQS